MALSDSNKQRLAAGLLQLYESNRRRSHGARRRRLPGVGRRRWCARRELARAGILTSLLNPAPALPTPPPRRPNCAPGRVQHLHRPRRDQLRLDRGFRLQQRRGALPGRLLGHAQRDPAHCTAGLLPLRWRDHPVAAASCGPASARVHQNGSDRGRDRIGPGGVC